MSLLTRRFGRQPQHRQLMKRNLATSILRHEQVKTTLAKAKDIRSFVEKLITLAKVDTVSNRRRAFSLIRDKEIVNKLFTEIAVRSKERPGGYLRVLKCGFRAGDAAPMAYVMLVDASEQ